MRACGMKMIEAESGRGSDSIASPFALRLLSLTTSKTTEGILMCRGLLSCALLEILALILDHCELAKTRNEGSAVIFIFSLQCWNRVTELRRKNPFPQI